MTFIRTLVQTAIVLLLVAGICSAQAVRTAHRRTLDELTDESAFILHGHVASVRIEPHPDLSNLQTVLVSIHVDDVLKGTVPSEFTFRQFVWDVHSLYDNGGYHKRQELLLFLRAPSRYGLTSPAGLEQGRFVIHRDASGNITAVNGENNAGLFTSLPKAAQRRGAVLSARAQALASRPAGPVALNDLKQAVRSLTGNTQ
jgi:hypothetical protein